MKIETDTMLTMLVICGAVYLAGYTALAVGVMIIAIVGSLISGGMEKRERKGVSMGGINVQGAEMLEPIIIETTRGPPFRIPSKMDIRIKPNWGAKTWPEKASKGLASVAKIGYRSVRGEE